MPVLFSPKTTNFAPIPLAEAWCSCVARDISVCSLDVYEIELRKKFTQTNNIMCQWDDFYDVSQSTRDNT